jgi:hypothetical protein
MSEVIWQHTITQDMVGKLDDNQLSLFIDSLEDSIDEIYSNFDVVSTTKKGQ